MRKRYLVAVAAVLVLVIGCFNPTGPPPNVEPTQVVGVAASSDSLTAVTVTWTQVTGDETPTEQLEYEIHWATTAGESATAFQAKATATGVGTAVVGAVPGYTTIYLSVRAVDADGAAGAPSAEVSITTSGILGFVDGGDAEVDAPPSGLYQATAINAESLGDRIYLSWFDTSISEFQAAVLPDGDSLFTMINSGGFSDSVAAGGGGELYEAGITLSAANINRYAPAPTDAWTDVTGSTLSGDTDEFVSLGEIDGIAHALIVSNNGATQQAILWARGASDWTQVSGGPVFSSGLGTWLASPLAPVGTADAIYVIGTTSNGPQALFFDGTSWTDITTPSWVATSALAIATTADSVFVLINDGSGVASLWEYSGAGTAWTQVQADIRYDASKLVQDGDLIEINGTLYISWTETSATGDRTRLGVFTAAAQTPDWQIIDGTGPEGLNSDPTTYDSRQPTLLAHGSALHLFFTEDNGVATVEILQAYKVE